MNWNTENDRIDFRPLLPSDETFLAEMLYQAIFVPEGATPPARQVVDLPGLRKYYAEFGRVGDVGIAAVDPASEQPVGAAWLRLLVGNQQGYGYVDDETPELSMALLPAYRGRGIGRQLLERVFEAARGLYPTISLSVWPDNQPAYRLYQQLGFEIIQENAHDVIMRKTL